jgi:hypothetical protein
MASNEAAAIPVYLELGAKRVFAGALDWPGWCRSGKNEEQALTALAATAARYAVVAREAGIPYVKLPGSEAFRVVERLPGSATTDFGAPAAIPASDFAPLGPAEAERLAAVVAAVWTVFDHIVASAPAELRKGPRGGGRDRDAVVEHVLGAESVYARKIGVRLPQPALGDLAAIATLRGAITDALRNSAEALPARESGWPVRYAARRIAWHILDHAWEIQDRSN